MKFRIEDPKTHEVKYVKAIDKPNHKISFTTEVDEAYDRDGHIYSQLELGYIKFHFKKEHPEVEYCEIVYDDTW